MASLDNPSTDILEYDDDDEFLYGSTLPSTNEQVATEKNSYSFPRSEQKSTSDKDGNDLYDPSHPTSDDKVEDDDLYDIYGEAAVEQSNGGGHQPSTTSRNPAVDINAVGQIEGVNLYDVDLDSFEDKPWRKPGADITDYFNFGFNEHTWRSYCAKQKQIREDQHQRKRINVYESKQHEHRSEHSRYQQRGRGRRGRDHDDSVIQVVSSEREAVLEELEPIPPPQIVDGRQNDDYGMQDTGYPQDFPGPPMGVHMFGAPPEMGGPIGGPIGAPPPFFMGNPEMPPTGPMGYDPSFRGGQPMRQMMRSGGMPGMPSRIPPGMPSAMSGGMPGGMPGRIPPGMPSGMAGAMMSRGRGMPMEDRSYFSMDEPSSWDMDNRNQSQYRPNFPNAPFAHRMRPSSLHRSGGGRDTSVDSRISDRAGGEDERDRIERSGGGGDRLYPMYDSREREDSRGYPSRALREEERWDVSRKRSGSSVPRDEDEFRTKRRH
ncbi:6015_t:CDS:10 [Ambispora leptoticha]|uniref:6015_t:CDS:1 n=1 Tax=Ambispora leptoticha TaxID=144679 RepID=A0A9N9FPI9_9GLOM|nr:6015_t:CDS:10 [Ambispora leptoticha]